MGSGLSSPLGVAGIIFIVVGIIMAIVGIIILIVNANNEKGWYIWLLLVGGIVLGIAGGIMLAIALMNTPSTPYCDQLYGCDMKQPNRQCDQVPVVKYPVQTPVVQYQAQPTVQYQTQPTVQYQAQPTVQYQAQAPVVQYQAQPTVQYQPQYLVQGGGVVGTGGVPNPRVTIESRPLGQPTFDPYPYKQEYIAQGNTQNVIARGPYTPNGQPLPGVLKTPANSYTVTTDYPEHTVNVNY